MNEVTIYGLSGRCKEKNMMYPINRMKDYATMPAIWLF